MSEPFGLTQAQIDGLAQRVHSYHADDFTLSWGKQTSKYRNSVRKDMRDMLRALEYYGYSLTPKTHNVDAVRANAIRQSLQNKGLLPAATDTRPETVRYMARTFSKLCEEGFEREKALEAKLAAVSAALDALDNALAIIGGCGDGNCIVVKPKGQHTNGGCRCSQDRMKMQRFAFAMNQFRDVVARVCEASK